MNNENPMLTLALPLSAVNYVLQALSARPHAEVDELIRDVVTQVQARMAVLKDEQAIKAAADAPQAAPKQVRKSRAERRAQGFYQAPAVTADGNLVV